MRKLVFGLVVLLAVGCKSGDSVEEQGMMDYFYPLSAEPVVYVYQDVNNPLYEVFERVFVTEDVLGKHFWIERYNTEFMLTETTELLVDKQLRVHNHLVGVRGDLRNAEVKDSTYYPFFGPSHFSSLFPSNVDTISFYLDMRRSLTNEKGTFAWEDKELETIVVIDSLKNYMIDTKNRREKVTQTVGRTSFAKGLGKVYVESADGQFALKLARILTDKEWRFVVTKE
jgi:hypothetical protein